MKLHVLTLLTASVTSMAAPAFGAFVVPNGVNFPWVRSVTPNSAYAEWDRFASAAGPNTPDVGTFVGGTFPVTAPSFNAFDANPFSFITGGGNIYSPSGIVSPRVVIPNFGLGAGAQTTILVQIRTLGTEADPATVNIGGVAPTSVTELSRVPLGGFGGFRVDTLYRFELAGNADGYLFGFTAAQSSLSLDRVAVDTFVPAPSFAGFLGACGVVCARRRR